MLFDDVSFAGDGPFWASGFDSAMEKSSSQILRLCDLLLLDRVFVAVYDLSGSVKSSSPRSISDSSDSELSSKEAFVRSRVPMEAVVSQL